MDLAAGEELLRLDAVTKTYVDHRFHHVVALADVNLTVARGEFVAIIGPSGCGKTTLLRLAAGLDFPSSGAVLYNGRPVVGPDKDRALVFQAYSAFAWLTVRQNIAFGLGKRSRSDDRVIKWLSATGLVDFADAYPKGLSGGMRQRLAIARAMIMKPSLLLLDEPFGALDDRTRDTMRQLLLSAANETRCSVILVTHDIREAILLADRVVVLSPRPGRVVDIVRTALPKPRTRKLLSTPEFGSLYQLLSEVWECEDRVPETSGIGLGLGDTEELK